MRSSKVVPRSTTLAGSVVTLARVRAKVTQRQLAEASGIAQSTIARIESGAADPQVSTVERLLASVGLEMRTRIEPIDNHDQVLEAARAALPAEQREVADRRHESNRRKFADAGRRAGL